MISVIIPTFNRGHVISNAIDSVLSQTYTDFEILVIDDGSTDDTLQTLKKYGERIKYFYQPNAGPSAARNLGIKKAKGKYICFLDSDDIIYPDKFKIQVNYLKRHPYKHIVYSGWKTYESDGVTLIDDQKPEKEKNILKYLLFTDNYFTIHSVLIKKSAFELAGLFNENLHGCEDRDLWLRMALSGCRFGSTTDYVCEYRFSPDSFIRKTAELDKADQYLFQRTLLDSRLPDSILEYIHEIQAQFLYDKALIKYSKEPINSSSQKSIINKFLREAENINPKILIKYDALEKAISHRAIFENKKNPEKYLVEQIDEIFDKTKHSLLIKRRLFARTYINFAFQYMEKEDFSQAFKYLLRGILYQPKWLINRGVLSTLIKIPIFKIRELI